MLTQPQTSCPLCPRCGKSLTRYTIQSSAGHYCLCYACGHAWHHDRQPAPENRDAVGVRPKTDRAMSVADENA